MSDLKDIFVIPPKGKRDYNIIFKANYNPDYKEGGKLDEKVAKTLGNFNFFVEE